MDYLAKSPDQLSNILRGARAAKKLTQQAVGQKIGLSQVAIAKLEQSPGTTSVARLLAVMSALGLELVVRDMPKHGDPAQGEW